MTKPEYIFDANRDVKAIQSAWEIDPRLSLAFRKLIPRHVSKNEFWRHYLKNALHTILAEFYALLQRYRKWLSNNNNKNL